MAEDEKKHTAESVAAKIAQALLKAAPAKKKPPKHQRAAAKKRWGRPEKSR
jgi:hypothetical protein